MRRPGAVPMTMLLAVVAYLVLVPLALTVLSSFQLAPPGDAPVWGLDGWRRALGDPSILSALGNTISLAVVRVAIALVIGILLAWLIARTDLPRRNALEFTFWLAFFLPTLPVTMGWILLFNPKVGLVNQWLETLPFVKGPIFDINSFWGIIWAHLGSSTIGAVVLLLTPAFRNLDSSIEEASRSCGATALGTLRRIVIPLLAPAILIGMVAGLIRSLEAFEIELLLGVPVGIQVYSTKIRDLVLVAPPQYAPATALGTLFLLLLLVLVVLQRWYLRGRVYRTITGRGFSTRPMRLGRWRWPLFAIVALLAATITILPMSVLLMGTFMTVFGFFDLPHPWTLENWRTVLSDSNLLRSAQNTVIVGLGSAIVGVLFYGLIAYVAAKTRFWGRGALHLLAWLPFAIPGVLMGLALLWAVFATPLLAPLYGTTAILIVAMGIRNMPVGVQMTHAVLLQLGDELEESSRISGGNWLQTYRRIVLPLLAPALVTVGLISFMAAARDISTFVLLGSSQSRTLALLALNYAYSGQFEQGTVVAMLTVILVVVTAGLARFLGARVGMGTDAGSTA